jgi:hypothetical protein
MKQTVEIRITLSGRFETVVASLVAIRSYLQKYFHSTLVSHRMEIKVV